MDNLLIFLICLGVFEVGLLARLGMAKPTMNDVVTLDNQRCILVYEQDLIHKFCEAE